MAIQIPTDYRQPIEIGTRADYGSIAEANLYVKMGEGTTPHSRSSRTVLTQAQALDLASVLLRTVKDLREADTS